MYTIVFRPEDNMWLLIYQSGNFFCLIEKSSFRPVIVQTKINREKGEKNDSM